VNATRLRSRDAVRPRRAARPKAGGGKSVGQEIIDGLTELVEAMERGEPLGRRFTVRTVELPDEPRRYDAAAVRATRAKLGASQTVFARLLAVSPKLVQAWEQGDRVPAGPACRLLDDINSDPGRWVERFKLDVEGR
jgi:putative transcriptional regulator